MAVRCRPAHHLRRSRTTDARSDAGRGAAAAPPEGLRQGRVKDSVRVGAHRGAAVPKYASTRCPARTSSSCTSRTGPRSCCTRDGAGPAGRATPPESNAVRPAAETSPKVCCPSPARVAVRRAREFSMERRREGRVGDVLLAGFDVLTVVVRGLREGCCRGLRGVANRRKRVDAQAVPPAGNPDVVDLDRPATLPRSAAAGLRPAAACRPRKASASGAIPGPPRLLNPTGTFPGLPVHRRARRFATPRSPRQHPSRSPRTSP